LRVEQATDRVEQAAQKAGVIAAFSAIAASSATMPRVGSMFSSQPNRQAAAAENGISATRNTPERRPPMEMILIIVVLLLLFGGGGYWGRGRGYW
jgi:hypothetical protein